WSWSFFAGLSRRFASRGARLRILAPARAIISPAIFANLRLSIGAISSGLPINAMRSCNCRVILTFSSFEPLYVFDATFFAAVACQSTAQLQHTRSRYSPLRLRLWFAFLVLQSMHPNHYSSRDVGGRYWSVV